MLDEMAISNYLGLFLILLLSYPFALVVLQITIFEVRKRERVTFWFNLTCLAIALFLMWMHMQTEVIYGKSLLDAWYAENPE